jgi:hypothetical protein
MNHLHEHVIKMLLKMSYRGGRHTHENAQNLLCLLTTHGMPLISMLRVKTGEEWAERLLGEHSKLFWNS